MLELKSHSNFINKIKNWAFAASLLLVSFLILLRDVGGVSVPKSIFIVLFLAAMIISDKSDIYCLLAFMTPISKGISYSYIALFALLLIIFKTKKLQIGILAFVSLFGILLLELFSGFFYSFNFIDYIRFVGILLVCFLFMNDRDRSYDIPKMLRYFLFGFLVTILSLWGQMLMRYSLTALFLMGIRFGDTRNSLSLDEGMVISYNENELAFLCILTLWVGFSYMRYGGKLRGIVFVLMACVQGVLTQSRTFILVLVVSLFLIILTSLSSQKAIVAIISLAATLVISILLLRNYFSVYVESLMLRFEQADITGNRGYIMEAYSEIWSEQPWKMVFGAGIQDYSAKYGLPFYAHNSIQEVLLIWGILGLVLVVILFTASIRNGKKVNPQVALWQYAPFCIYLLLTQSAQGFSDFAGLFRLMIAYSVILMEFSSGKQILDNNMENRKFRIKI